MVGRFSDQHRLAHAVQNDAAQVGNLIDDPREQLPGKVGRRLQFLVGSRAGCTKQIAAIRRLEIEAYGRARAERPARLVSRLVITPRVDRGRLGVGIGRLHRVAPLRRAHRVRSATMPATDSRV